MEPDRLLLIVEDDAAFARTLGRSFERRGYTVLLASNLEEVNTLLETHTPDYAVVDLKLTGADRAWLVCRRCMRTMPIRSLSCLQGLPASRPR